MRSAPVDLRRRASTVVRAITFLAVLVLVLGACGSEQPDAGTSAADRDTDSDTSAATDGADEQTRFPDVLDVEITPLGDGRYEVAVTMSSPYDSPERYADAWRVLDEAGDELGVRELLHDHASEQPFTRSETVTIPDDVDQITVEGRDQISGYGGATVTVEVPRGD